MTMAQANGLAGDTRGPVDQRLTAEIEGFRGTLGEPIYAEILRRAGHSADARTIPNAERQKQTIEKMQAAARGFERLRNWPRWQATRSSSPWRSASRSRRSPNCRAWRR
jgi:predicted exporter